MFLFFIRIFVFSDPLGETNRSREDQSGSREETLQPESREEAPDQSGSQEETLQPERREEAPDQSGSREDPLQPEGEKKLQISPE